MVATETVGPFDGTPWAQDQWYRYAPSWAPSGVIDAQQSVPSAGALGLSFNGLTPTIAAGRAWVRGAGYELAGGSKTLAAVAANTNASLSRRDRLVLRRDLAAKTVAPVLLQGTPAASPASPALTQVETGQWDFPLFSWLTPPNSGTSVSGIVDERVFLRPGGALAFQTTTVDGALYTSSHAVLTLNIPDPGYTYCINASGSVLLHQLGAGVGVRPSIQVNGADLIPWGGYTQNLGSTTMTDQVALSPVTPVMSSPLTGAATVTFLITKDGTAGNGFMAQTGGSFGILWATVIPA